MVTRSLSLISTCAIDREDIEICLNDVVWHMGSLEYGLVTRHKGDFYFENLNSLIPFSIFKGYIKNGLCKINEITVEKCTYSIERFFRNIFTEKDVG